MSARSPATLHLLVGPVGAGKSTWARRRVARDGGVFLDLDAWMVRLYGGDPRPPEDRPQERVAWYLERRARCQGLLWDVSVEILSAGVDVVLEIGLVRRAEREDTYARARAQDLALVVHAFDAPRSLRRERVAERNACAGPHTQIVPPEFFERASDAWEPVTPSERAAWNVVDV